MESFTVDPPGHSADTKNRRWTEAAPVPVLASEMLLRGTRTVRIRHAGREYVLRVTRENKLILTK